MARSTNLSQQTSFSQSSRHWCSWTSIVLSYWDGESSFDTCQLVPSHDICWLVFRAALYHFGLKDGAKQSFRRLKPALYVFDGVLGAAFITLLIVYFSLSDQITITCESNDIDINSATPKQIVAIVYKAFFAVVCIILSIAFLVYGSRIIRSSTSFTVRSLDRAEQRAIKKRKQDVLNVSEKLVVDVRVLTTE